MSEYGMINALDELRNIIQEVEEGYDAEFVAVDIHLNTSEDYMQTLVNGKYNEEMTHVQFIVGKTDKDIDELLAPLDKEYYHLYGTQYLFGTIWFTKGIWADRYEYDGLERWDVHVYPDLPKSEE